ncbi:hypothetical protein CLF_106022 [Clonorchis sinensis]|uniref:Cadherin domain-containing protein n=1 Tax=Clonorchis sinensis TaxID=79923 RepID=H2KRD5_CLOSI|nr:hypothetical protein CLF_106022 [Clonorchis sinensis]
MIGANSLIVKLDPGRSVQLQRQDPVLRRKLIVEFHEMTHTGCTKTYELLRQRAYWPWMRSEAMDYVVAFDQETGLWPKPRLSPEELEEERRLEKTTAVQERTRQKTAGRKARPFYNGAKVLAVDRDEGPNGTVQYFMGNIGIYDFGRTEVDSNRCNAGWVKYKPITTRMGINLHEYFYMNSSTGKLRLARELPSKLVGHVCIITIVARDMGPFDRLETSLNICVKITDSPSRQINGSIAGYLRRAPQQRTLFYLYIVTGVLVSVLTLSITFVLAAYCLWYRGNVSNDKHLSNAIHYSEGELRPEETHRDANDFIYRIGDESISFTAIVSIMYISTTSVMKRLDLTSALEGTHAASSLSYHIGQWTKSDSLLALQVVWQLSIGMHYPCVVNDDDDI